MPPRLPYLCHRRLLHSPASRLGCTVLSIESSCDDTSVAILHSPTPATATILFHETITSPNRAMGGIHPLLSLTSHRRQLAPLLQRSFSALPADKRIPDIVAVTRGPGMIASLAVGLDTAKGLALAWNRPLIGVNHMLAHALTPRLVAALGLEDLGVEFPFLSVLVSGGHTFLVRSETLTSHRVLSSTIDIAIGDMVDKAARTLLPEEFMEKQGAVVAYGRLLEDFCFPNGAQDWKYHPPGTRERENEIQQKIERWGDWQLPVPLARRPQPKAFSFSGLGSAVERAFEARPNIEDEERRAMGREAMMASFEHVASRVTAALKVPEGKGIQSLVVSGGVASNRFLRHLLREYLDNAGFRKLRLVCPPIEYCTDNAAMIAWAGLEMYRAGWTTDMGALPIRKWSIDDVEECDEMVERGEEGKGGVLGVRGWIKGP